MQYLHRKLPDRTTMATHICVNNVMAAHAEAWVGEWLGHTEFSAGSMPPRSSSTATAAFTGAVIISRCGGSDGFSCRCYSAPEAACVPPPSRSPTSHHMNQHSDAPALAPWDIGGCAFCVR